LWSSCPSRTVLLLSCKSFIHPRSLLISVCFEYLLRGRILELASP
jgi:hypothetical protein